MEKTTLEMTLSGKTIAVLHQTALCYSIYHQSLLKKTELVSVLSEVIRKELIGPDLLFKIGTYPPPVYQTIRKAVDAERVEAPPDSLMAEYFTDCPFVHFLKPDSPDQPGSLSLPDEIKTALFPHLEELDEENNWAELIYRYTRAAVTLYGAVKSGEILHLILRYEHPAFLGQLSFELIMQVLSIRRLRTFDYFIENQWICHPSLRKYDGANQIKSDIESLRKRQEGIRRWYPDTKQEFLSFADPMTIPKSKPFQNFVDWMAEHSTLEKEKIREILLDEVKKMDLNGSDSFSNIVTDLLGAGICVNQGNALTIFCDKLAELTHSIHLRMLNGHKLLDFDQDDE